MKAIQPVHLHATGPRVSNLHKALLFLILYQSMTNEDRRILGERLAPEVRRNTFGRGTEHVVGLWQNQLKTWPDEPVTLPKMPQWLKLKLRNLPGGPINGGTGDVDELTAEALNWLLKQLGALSRQGRSGR